MSFKACVPALWMSSADSKWCLFTANFTFWNKKKFARWQIRQVRRLWYHHNAFGCQKLHLTAHPVVALCDSWAPSWHKIFLIPNSSASITWTVFRFMFTSSAIILTVHLQSDRKVLLPVLCCHLSMLLMVVHCTAHLQQWFCLQKTFCTSERLMLLTLHHLQRPAEVFHVFWCHCHQFNTKKDGIHTAAWCSVLAFPWQGSQTCPDTSSTYSILRHCKAMPLQVGMEEGSRSKAACVRGLQYCQYS